MFKLKSELSFDAAHFLPNHKGKCKNLHGHRYIVEYCVISEFLQENDSESRMVADFSDLKNIMKEIIDDFDHKLLIDISNPSSDEFLKTCEKMGFEIMLLGAPTTAENLAETIYYVYENKLREKYNNQLNLEYIKIYETPTNSATYYAD